MKKLFCSALICSALLGFNSTQASVLNFDDLNGGAASINSQAANYGGFSWGSSFFVLNDTIYDNDYLNSYGSPSGENAVYNGYGVQNVTLNGSTFDFKGAYFTGFAKNNTYDWFTATSITVEGYNGANLIGSATMNLLANGYSWLQADLMGITSLKFISSGFGQWWLMDNFTFDESIKAVPVPAAIWLFGSAFIGLIGLKRKTA